MRGIARTAVGNPSVSVSLSSVIALACALTLLASPASANAEATPFGHACKAQDGVRFCPAETLAQRVPSFDGVPLDVDVTLPASGVGPFPDDRDDARLGRQQGRVRVDHAGGQRQRNLSTTTTSTTPSTATPSSTTRLAAGGDRVAPPNRVRERRAATKAGCASPTSATRRATRSTCSDCSPTNTWSSRAPSASPASHTAAGRAWSSHT